MPASDEASSVGRTMANKFCYVFSWFDRTIPLNVIFNETSHHNEVGRHQRKSFEGFLDSKGILNVSSRPKEVT